MKKTLKLIALMMIAAMLVTGATLPASATGEAPEMSIDYCNLSFRDSVCIKYAVKSTSTEDTTVLLWNEPAEEYLYGTHVAELETVGNQTISGETYKVFDYTALAAKQMTDVLYARAYTVVDGEAYYSDVVKYSILQYAYNKLGKTAAASTDEDLKTLLSSMLEYGANAQKYFEYSADRLATDDFYQVKTSGGLIDDGCNHGLYLEGDKVNIIAPATNDEGVAFSRWENGAGETVANTAKATITVEATNDVYTAVYAKTSAGLEFDTNGDGTCCLVSIGDCTDTDIIIPMTSPDGGTVTSIDSSAFAGEAITSVTIPATIEEIGRKAFSGCDSLTDVYYEGSKEEWEVLCDSIGTYNDSILNANIHFAKVTTYTVTFVDYDGTPLSEQSVASGEAATAPTAPSRDGYTFTGWDKAFDNVTENLTVTAQYEKNETTYDGPTIAVSSTSVNAGEKASVTVSLNNNPGAAVIMLDLVYDDQTLTLTDVVYGDEFAQNGEQPRFDGSPDRIVWSSVEDISGTHDFITLNFDVSSTAQSGAKYDIVVSYAEGEICNSNEELVNFNIVNGSVTIK